MLKKANRFAGSRSIRRLYTHSRSVRTRQLALRFATQASSIHVGVVVSKKVHKSAVVRNRIRRRVYEVVRSELLPSLKQGDYLITVFHPSLATTPSPLLTQEVLALFAKVALPADNHSRRPQTAPGGKNNVSHGIVNS